MPQLAPYLPFSVEEVASITTLDHWSNCKARVLGRLLGWDQGTQRGRLGAVGEGLQAVIRVCFKALQESDSLNSLQVGQVIQVLGELEMYKGDPIVRIHILRDKKGVDSEAYYRALCRVQGHLPVNVERRLGPA
jgi:hypothetical protein